jgi:choline dehydrogenase-like flavoprotein
MNNDYDIIIIGSGAGGGTLARHLAPSGKRIFILERGGWLPRDRHPVAGIVSKIRRRRRVAVLTLRGAG